MTAQAVIRVNPFGVGRTLIHLGVGVVKVELYSLGHLLAQAGLQGAW